jgi:hypothetical protein
LPAPQSWQAALDAAPIVCEYFPAAHAVQLLDPPVEEYVPWLQLQHRAESPVPKLPAAQAAHALVSVARPSPAAHGATTVPPSASVGVGVLVELLKNPSCPSVLGPQHSIVPSDSSAHAW